MLRRAKEFITRQKSTVSGGLVKYNNFVFWWKVDSDRYGSSFVRWWRWRRAYKEGVLDFYMKAMLGLAGFTLVYGFYRGYRKRGAHSYHERVNSLKLEELDLEIDTVKILMEME